MDTQGIVKISAADAALVLSKVPEVLLACDRKMQKQASEITELKEKVANFETRDRVEGVFQLMEERNIHAGMDEEERRAMLLEKAAEGRLEVVEQAVKLAAEGNPLGNVSDVPASTDGLLGYLMGEE
jgi:hypothetical protein